MGILRDIRYNSVLVFQPVSGVREPQAINQVRRHPGGYEGPGEVLMSLVQCPVNQSFVSLPRGRAVGG
jgi:hypothetical protein